MDLGVQVIRCETFVSAADMGRAVFQSLGIDPAQARALVSRFAEHDERRLNEYHSAHDNEEKIRDLAKENAREL